MQYKGDLLKNAIDITNKNFNINFNRGKATIKSCGGTYEYDVVVSQLFYLFIGQGLTTLKIRRNSAAVEGSIVLHRRCDSKDEIELAIGITAENYLALIIGEEWIVDTFDLKHALTDLLGVISKVNALALLGPVVLARLQVLKAKYSLMSEISKDINIGDLAWALIEFSPEIVTDLAWRIDEGHCVNIKGNTILDERYAVMHSVMSTDIWENKPIIVLQSNASVGDITSFLLCREDSFVVARDKQGEYELASSVKIKGLSKYIEELYEVTYGLAFIFIKGQIIEALNNAKWNWTELEMSDEKIDQYIHMVLKNYR